MAGKLLISSGLSQEVEKAIRGFRHEQLQKPAAAPPTGGSAVGRKKSDQD